MVDHSAFTLARLNQQSPTILMESVLLTAMIEAQEH